MSVMTEFIHKAKSVLCLPIEILKEVTMLVRGPAAEKTAFHTTSLMLCGILITSSHKEVHLLWSPLDRPEISSIELNKSSSMDQIVMQWVLGRLSVAITAFDIKARELYAKNWPDPCLGFSSKGAQLSATLLSYSHAKISRLLYNS